MRFRNRLKVRLLQVLPAQQRRRTSLLESNRSQAHGKAKVENSVYWKLDAGLFNRRFDIRLSQCLTVLQHLILFMDAGYIVFVCYQLEISSYGFHAT